MAKNQKPDPRPSGITQVDTATSHALEQLTAKAQQLGIPGFVLLFQPAPGVSTVHIFQMRFKSGLECVVSAFNQLIAIEIKNHPEYSDSYKKSLYEMYKDMADLLVRANKRFDGLKK